MKFYISELDGVESLEEQYKNFRGSLGELDPKSKNGFYRYDIKESYGKGYMEVYELKDKMKLTIYNLVFEKEVDLHYIVKEEHFEIEYCIEGSMKIIQEEEVLFKEGDISISNSKNTEGIIRYEAGEKYIGISITTDAENIENYFGSSGKEVWERTIEALDKKKRQEYYYGIQVPHEIRNSFFEIYNCNYNLDIRKLYLESKIMEILTKIMSIENEIIDLDKYEVNIIKKIPNIMLENLFELPTIDQLSRQLGINKNKLTKGFREIYGDSIFSYHRKKSLDKASIYLISTDKSISEIALDIGYSNSSNFGYAFKKQFGVSPKQYRKFNSRET